MKTNCKYSREEIQKAVENSKSYAEVFRNLGFTPNGGSYPWLKTILKRFKIDISHFNFIDSSEVKNRLTGKKLRAILRKASIDEKCNRCGLTDWLGDRLRLDVDHIDGDLSNNSPENLQFLCPNCHRKKTTPYKDDLLLGKSNKCSCGTIITDISLQCKDCHWDDRRANYVPKISSRLPDVELLSELVWEFPLTELSKQFGISDVGIKKNLKKLKIPFPGKSGYWMAINSKNFSKATEIRKQIENH